MVIHTSNLMTAPPIPSKQLVNLYCLKIPMVYLEVQTRQRAQDDNFSLNAAVAMNIAGDRFVFLCC